MAGAIPESPGGGLLGIKSNALLKSEEEASLNATTADNEAVISSLASYIRRHWEAAKNAKTEIERRLLRCYRQKKGKYEPDDMLKIKKFGGSDIFMMLTNIKCRTIESWMKDVMLPSGEKPWSISPTESPSLPESETKLMTERIQSEVMAIIQQFGPDAVTNDMIDERVLELTAEFQQRQRSLADKECLRVEALIEDELQEGGFYEEIAKYIKDFSVYCAAFLKGPTVTRQLKLVWEQLPDGGAVPAAQFKTVRRFTRVSPFDIYTSPGSRHLNDGYLFERMRLRAAEVYQMKGVPGYKDELVDKILDNIKNGSNMKDWLWTDQERAILNNRPQEQDDPQAQVEALEYHGDIPAQLLIEWGMDAALFDDPKKPISCAVLLVGNEIPMVKLNAHPLGLMPYYSTSFDPSNESLWGEAPPELLEDCQRVCNAAARSVVNNMALGSGPQVEVHKDRVDPGDDIESIYPWKIWKTKSDVMGHGRNAVTFFQPDIVVDKLMNVYDKFFGQASEQLGVPAYESGVGDQASGAGKTAHGLSMLMSAASKIIKEAIVNVDTAVLKKAIEATWVHMMLFDDIKARGDVNVVARASEYLIIAETLRERRTQFLAVTNNPTDMAIIGIKGRAAVLRETAKALKMNEDVVPTEAAMDQKIEEERARAEELQAQVVAGEAGGPGAGGPDGSEPFKPKNPDESARPGTSAGRVVPTALEEDKLTPPLESMAKY